MEPMVMFGAVIVMYSGFLSLADAVRDRQRERGSRRSGIRRPGEFLASKQSKSITAGKYA